MNVLPPTTFVPSKELLEERIRDKEGQQVLVVREQVYSTGQDIKVFLGVLTHAPIRENQSEVLLPTEKYLHRRIIKGVAGSWERIEGNLPVKKMILLPSLRGEVTGPVVVQNFYGVRIDQQEGRSLLVAVGDEAPRYFAKGGPFRNNDIPDDSYVAALALLGYNVVPLLFQAAQQQFVKQRALDTFTALEILTAQEKVAGIQERGLGNQERRILQSRIRSALLDAFEVDMHKEPLTIQGHNPGVSVDVPAYLQHVANSYKIRIPK